MSKSENAMVIRKPLGKATKKNVPNKVTEKKMHTLEMAETPEEIKAAVLEKLNASRNNHRQRGISLNRGFQYDVEYPGIVSRIRGLNEANIIIEVTGFAENFQQKITQTFSYNRLSQEGFIEEIMQKTVGGSFRGGDDLSLILDTAFVFKVVQNGKFINLRILNALSDEEFESWFDNVDEEDYVPDEIEYIGGEDQDEDDDIMFDDDEEGYE